MRVALERTPLRRCLLTVGACAVLTCAGANAQDLDQGKSGVKLFADSCVACHRSAGGLAKGRFRLTLFMFLRDHYATNSNSAWELASYLEAVEGAPHGRSRKAAGKSSLAATSVSGAPPRPPRRVPEH
jgi:mono/diheme cytochrome c family protein